MGATLTKGTAVVGLADGAKLGTIEDLYLDPKRREIVGFSVRRRRRWRRATVTVVDASDVHAFGPDAVTLANPAALRGNAVLGRRHAQLVEVGALFGRGVVTEGGTDVGRVTSLGFDRTTRRLRWLEVEAAGQAAPGLVWGDEVLRVGGEQVVVAEAVLAAAPAWAGRPVASRHTPRPTPRRALRPGPAHPLAASSRPVAHRRTAA